ncbi:hypothetical protein BASA83_013220 [Batrachochytrium salamandrivorans]|nr:hypothetical protein BASA83_013220 [Batrachochytrium salamandrivorans]
MWTEVTWGIYQPESTNMGIIKLGSFDPEETGTKSLAIEKAIMIVRSLLVNELKDTNSVIYELRGNPGGSAKFADSMVQLFKPDFEPFGSRYLMNDLTYDIFVVNKNPNVNLHARAWKETEPGSRFHRCFFPSLDGVYPSLLRFGFEDFRKFPFTQELTSGSKTHANTLSVGVTQVVRTGLYKGQIIEDVVSRTDTVFRPQWSDLQPDSPTNTQYDRIAESLARTGQENGQSRLHFVCEPFLIVKPINGFSLEVETAGIERFTVQIIIVGKTAGVQVLKTKRNVRIIPDDDKYMEIQHFWVYFTGLSDSVGLYQSPATVPGNGWNNLKGPWMIGSGVRYVENIDSSIEAFFSAPVGTNINIGIDVALDSMPGHDFLYLYVKSSDGVEDFLLRSKNRDGAETLNGVSGLDMIVKETFPFTTKSGKCFYCSQVYF